MTNQQSGKMIYTDRAFRQDASEAMKGNIVTGLIELITNCDDAYKDVSVDGPIYIEIANADAPYKYKLVVRDHAKGLPGEMLRKSFVELGAENRSYLANKGAEEGSRGLFGRGAKDVAIFGKALFESICAGKYSAVELDPFEGSWNMIASDVPATQEHRKALGLLGESSGLSATILVHKMRAPMIPNTPKLVEQLSNHVSLRGIVGRHKVTFVDSRTNKSANLKFQLPAYTELLNQEFDVPGYKQKVALKFYKFNDRQTGNLDEFSYHGLVIRDKRGNYENTFLSLSSRPESGWFGGEILAPEIDVLNRQIDEIEKNHESTSEETVKANPMRLVKRSREGLERSHPYYRALDKLVQDQLRKFFDEVAAEEDANKSEGQDLRKRLDLASRSLAELLQETLDEAEAGDLPEGGSGADFTKISIVPPKKFIEKGKTATVTLRAPQFDFKPDQVKIELIDTSGTFSLVDTELKWREHERLSVMQAALKVEAREFGSTELLFTYSGETASATLICEPVPTENLPDPTALQFEEDSYFLAPTRARNIRLLAPAEMLGEKVVITSESKEITTPSVVELKLDASGTFCFAKVKCVAQRELGTYSVKAILVDSVAETSIIVRESDANKGPKISIQIKNQDAPNRSALLLGTDILRIEIYAKHKAVKNIIGSHDGEKYKYADSPAWHATLVELVSTQLVNYAIEREFSVYPHKFRDATSLFIKQQSLMTKFVTTMQVFLLAEGSTVV